MTILVSRHRQTTAPKPLRFPLPLRRSPSPRSRHAVPPSLHTSRSWRENPATLATRRCCAITLGFCRTHRPWQRLELRYRHPVFRRPSYGHLVSMMQQQNSLGTCKAFGSAKVVK